MTDSHMEPTVTDAPLLPCGLCGAPCRSEIFSNSIVEATPIWVCPNAAVLGGSCDDATIYLDADAWNRRQNTRSMEAKPDPEGDGWTPIAMLQRRRLDALSLGGSTEIELSEIDALLAALTAKPSPEPMRRELGDAGDAIDFACGHIADASDAIDFLDNWRADFALHQYPEYTRWLTVQRDGVARAKCPICADRLTFEGNPAASFCDKHYRQYLATLQISPKDLAAWRADALLSREHPGGGS